MQYEIQLTHQARKMLGEIRDRRVQQKIAERIDALVQEPEKQGKGLIGNLSSYRSAHAVGRYRIIYRADLGQVIVLVVAIGVRKEGDKRDVYTLVRRLIDLGLVERPP